ncbi:orotidine-5'-phosphate decarboxylase [Natronoglycomyces albus]|uniref:Orotidine 5'-phosphate decarboxylase n=1 Tax=Natronoglycomyces albus TaxID=2811108 RepID=A0A895XNS3_9ACTN|nr:orotidine-5'-phosphate decarboxylase [Natronoglycomyces albus]QSB05193.1 orotidine-5'-phosphate decarboxylase [Natronoglycomyces albus]
MSVHTERSSSPSRDKLCLALDLTDRAALLDIVDELKDLVGWFKINSAFTLFGPELVRELLARDVRVFLDLKLHDIPNTLAGYGTAVTELGAHLVTVHTSGGVDMMRSLVTSADEAAAQLNKPRPTFVGVTILTSTDQTGLNQELNVPGTVEEEVARRAGLAKEAGLDGIVCAPVELATARKVLPDAAFLVTPGTRSPGVSGNDHRRVGTHANAIADGSSLLVIGRQVLHSEDRRTTVAQIVEEIEEARA